MMACIGCEEFAKRVTNVYRDEDLKEKYSCLTGYEIHNDCFICDSCNIKLKHALDFKASCIRIHKKNNPNSISIKSVSSLPSSSTVVEGNKDEFFIIENNEDPLSNDDDAMSQSQFVKISQTTASEEDGNEFCIYELKETPKSVNSNALKESIMMHRKIKPNYKETSEDSIDKPEEIPKNKKIRKKGERAPRKSYSLYKKLEVIEYAEKHSNREASRRFSLNESSVRCFRRQKESLLKLAPTKSTNRHGTPHWPELELKLKEWTEEQSKKPKINEIKDQAIKIAKELDYDSFIGSTSWTFKFMQRHNIDSSQPRPRKMTLKTEVDD